MLVVYTTIMYVPLEIEEGNVKLNTRPTLVNVASKVLLGFLMLGFNTFVKSLFQEHQPILLPTILVPN
jgi:hypothetical protein